ncbi:MAG: hypothetical protein Q8K36_02625, partial [Alphaproteobacteria bacterium]|nr:hypothetical protein [Alphaproteobacteria bacterium]
KEAFCLSSAGQLHLLPSQQAQELFHKERDNKKLNPGSLYSRLQMTQIPQTTWDLFVVMQCYKEGLKIPGQEAIPLPIMWDIGKLGRNRIDLNPVLNNGFIRMVRDAGLVDAFKSRKFTHITDHLITSIYNHLRAFKEMKVSATKDPSPKLTVLFSGEALMFFCLDIYPEVASLLRHATKIEEDALQKDQLLLWRHTTSMEPAVPVVKQGPDTHNLTRSYGYSLLSCFISDGRMAGLNDYDMCSACVFSYYAQILRDRKYASLGDFPYTVPGQGYVSIDDLGQKLNAMNDNLSCLVLDKNNLNHDMFFLPTIFPNYFPQVSGEYAHPRAKGTLLSVAEKNEGLGVLRTTMDPNHLMELTASIPVIWVTFKSCFLEEGDAETTEKLTAARQDILGTLQA